MKTKFQCLIEIYFFFYINLSLYGHFWLNKCIRAGKKLYKTVYRPTNTYFTLQSCGKKMISTKGIRVQKTEYRDNTKGVLKGTLHFYLEIGSFYNSGV